MTQRPDTFTVTAEGDCYRNTVSVMAPTPQQAIEAATAGTDTQGTTARTLRSGEGIRYMVVRERDSWLSRWEGQVDGTVAAAKTNKPDPNPVAYGFDIRLDGTSTHPASTYVEYVGGADSSGDMLIAACALTARAATFIEPEYETEAQAAYLAHDLVTGAADLLFDADTLAAHTTRHIMELLAANPVPAWDGPKTAEAGA
jgi:hypothetical protein